MKANDRSCLTYVCALYRVEFSQKIWLRWDVALLITSTGFNFINFSVVSDANAEQSFSKHKAGPFKIERACVTLIGNKLIIGSSFGFVIRD
jgi:hypothetical protein